MATEPHRPNYYMSRPGGKIDATENVMEWAEWMEANLPMKPFMEGGRSVARTDLANGVFVSTVFLGLEPVLFETMIFGMPKEDYQERYETHEQATEGHAEAVQHARKVLAEQ